MKTYKQGLQQQTGFTLIEILVVVVILSILATFIVPNIMGKPEEARIAKARNDIRGLSTALDMYKLDNYSYPTTDQGLDALVNRPGGSPEPRNWREGGYIKQLEKDPWGGEYQFLSPGAKGEVDIYSFGGDGVESDDDIGSWVQDR